MDIQQKKDITRLKNLLSLYRDHIITNIANKNNVVTVVKKVDESICYINRGL